MNWINKNWAKIGGLISIAIVLFVLFSNPKLNEIESLFWIHFAIFLLHQFEEFVYPGKFKEFYNENILNRNRITRFPLNDNGIILVNVIFGWTAYLLSAILGENFIWLTIGLLGVTILNGIMHTIMFIIKRKYNPGFISGLLLFIPFGIFLLLKIMENITSENLIYGMIFFVIGTISVPLSILITNRIKVPNKV
ncbi:MAG: HXXEE domain-containing protein [Bacteroidota bacterium]